MPKRKAQPRAARRPSMCRRQGNTGANNSNLDRKGRLVSGFYDPHGPVRMVHMLTVHPERSIKPH